MTKIGIGQGSYPFRGAEPLSSSWTPPSSFFFLLSFFTMRAQAAALRYRALLDPDPEDADDERSLSDIEDDRYQPPRPHPQFAGQDVRETSKKELMGWYSYAWAAEVFVVCGIGSFIPVTLEQLARENGVLLSDKTTPCGASTEPGSDILTLEGPDQCVIYIMGWQMNTASFAMLVSLLKEISLEC